MKNILFLAFCLTLSKFALTVPSAFSSRCGALNINNETTSTLIRDHESCKTVWVLPPALGVVDLFGYTSNGNLGLCQDVKEVQKVSLSLTKQIGELQVEIKALSLIRKERILDVTNAKKEVFSLEGIPAIGTIGRHEERLEIVEDTIEKTYEKLATCTTTCQDLREKLRELKTEKSEIKAALASLRQEHAELHRQYRRAKAALASAEYALTNVDEEFFTQQEKITSLRTTMQQWLLFYSRLEGGIAHITYDTNWSENIRALNEKFKGKYEFKAIPTKNVRIAAQFVGSTDKDSYLGSMPAVLDYVIAGVKFTPWGEQGTIEQTSFPSRIGGSVRLSLMGGCPLYYANFLESDTLVKDETQNKSLGFSINATYEYPAAFKFDVTARYNLYKVYEKMVAASSHGGFFSSESYSKTAEDELSSDVFSIEWGDEDNTYTSEQKHEIQQTIKNELITTVLSMMASPLSSSSYRPQPITPTKTEHGAIIVAKGLSETCGYFDIFCLGGAWLIRGLDATFGSDSSRERFKARQNYVAEQRWSRTEAKWRSAATGFTSKE